jgi:phage shock protein A
MELEMAEQTVDLAFLGEQMKSLQTHARRMDAEMTVIREKVVLVESEQVELRDNLFHATGELTVRMGQLEKRTLGVERQLATMDAASSARFEQFAQTLTTNTQILLGAIKGIDQRLTTVDQGVAGLDRKVDALGGK